MAVTFKRTSALIVTATFVALPFVALWQRQAIFDWWRLRDFTPTAEIQSIAQDTTLTAGGEHLFYVYHASLQESEDFNQNCQFPEESIVLGCYVSGQGIYIYNVTDERLQGIKEVTAAHEVLHAAYERLSSKERTEIDKLVSDTFAKLNNDRIKKAVEGYRKRDPSVVPNELHSIIGTEVTDIPIELERHYGKYFTNRMSVVQYSQKYEAAFVELEKKAEKLQSKIESLRKQIDSLNESLLSTRNSLEQEFAQLQADRTTASPGPYNARVRAYNTRVQQYNADVQRSYSLIDSHNQLVNDYNATVVEEKELIQAIDSRPDTIDTQ